MFHPCEICSKSILSRFTLCMSCLSNKVKKDMTMNRIKSTKESCSKCGSTDLISLAHRLAATCSFCGESCSCNFGESVGMKQATTELKMAGKNPKKLCCRNMNC